MFRLGRRATLLVAFYLLASAATASAECAWVLWQAVRAGADSDWLPFDSYERLAECKREAEIARKGKDALKVFYVCLPDTVDPRGPKGK